MQKNKMIAPSTERAKTVKEILQLEKDVSSCADFLHVDIMDGVFVERVLLENKDLQNFSEQSKMKMDFHLMCNFSLNKEMIDFYISLNPHIISVHLEAFKNKEDLIDTLKKIKQNNIKAGIAVKLETDIKQVFEFLPLVDLVLIMSVKVGYGGQKFDPLAFEKIEKLHKEIKNHKHEILIQVDGGVNQDNAKTLFEKGADILVCGSFVYNSSNRCQTVNNLKN